MPEGELVDFVDEFSDGRIQFGFLRVKDPNTTLPKCVLVGWVSQPASTCAHGTFTHPCIPSVAKVFPNVQRDISPAI
jgi:hypothetical protein